MRVLSVALRERFSRVNGLLHSSTNASQSR